MSPSKLSMKLAAQPTLTSNTFAMKGDSSEAMGMPAPQPWHVLSADDVLAHTRTRPEGLTQADAAERLKTHGANVIPRGKGDTALDLIWRQINNPLIWVLLVSAVVAMAVDPTGGVKNGLVILAVVALNTIIGFVEAGHAHVCGYRHGSVELLPCVQPVGARPMRDVGAPGNQRNSEYRLLRLQQPV